MKKILCYGDSNTFGLIAEILERYEVNERWSGVLSELLKDDYTVIEEGLSDRNGFLKNQKGYEYNSQEHLPVYLNKTPNINIIILAVGTNDLQFTYDFNAEILEAGLLNLINIVKKYNKETKIIIVPPVKLDKYVALGYFNYQFNEISIERSNVTFDLYKKIADENNCYYFDFNQIARPSEKDGLHYTIPTHKLIAQKLAEFITTKIKN